MALIVLLGALGFAALLSLQPWTANSVAPRLSVAPGLGIALGDSVPVDPADPIAVAAAHPAGGGKSRLVADRPVAGEGASPQKLSIAPARVVVSARSVAPPAGSPEPSLPEPAPAPQASPEPVAIPVTVLPSGPEGGEPSRGGSGPSVPPPSTSGPGTIIGSPDEAVEVHEGDEHAFAFSFYLQPSAYLAPGDENLLLRFIGEGNEAPSFGLQLWDDGGGQRGLWASGDAMGGERFLAPVAEGVWHEAVVDFQASSEDDGFYLLSVDGQPIDARAWVSLIDSESGEAAIEVGLFRDGERVLDSPDISLGPTRLGDAFEAE